MNHFRSSFALAQFLWLLSTIVLFSTFCDCNSISKKLDSSIYEKVIFESDAYEYSYYSSYYRMIRLNQTFPNVHGMFEKLSSKNSITPQFKFKFHGTEISKFDIFPEGYIELYGEKKIGKIGFYVDESKKTECEFSNEKEQFAIRWSFFVEVEGSLVEAKATFLIQKNGKISFYYDDIPHAINKYKKSSTFSGKIQCGGDEKLINADVPEKWIKTGTLVEYEISGDCTRPKSFAVCEGAMTPDTLCFWCDKAKMWINGNDEDTSELKYNSCLIEYSLNVDDSSELTLTKQKETDLEKKLRKTTENNESHSNQTAETKGKPRNLLYIIIPIAISFVVLSIGCVIGIWLYRKHKINP